MNSKNIKKKKTSHKKKLHSIYFFIILISDPLHQRKMTSWFCPIGILRQKTTLLNESVTQNQVSKIFQIVILGIQSPFLQCIWVVERSSGAERASTSQINKPHFTRSFENRNRAYSDHRPDNADGFFRKPFRGGPRRPGPPMVLVTAALFYK